MGDAVLAFVVPSVCARRAFTTAGSPALCRASAVQRLRSALAYMWVPASADPLAWASSVDQQVERKRQVMAAYICCLGLANPNLATHAICRMERQGSVIEEGSGCCCLQANSLKALGGAVSYQ